MWKAQTAMRKNSMMLPGVMCLLASGLVLYQHIFPDTNTPIQTFLTLVLATMLPLAYVDGKISSCNDPIGLMLKFGPKVLLMHGAFLIFRMRLLFYPEEVLFNCTNVGGLIGVSIALAVGFRQDMKLDKHMDVLLLVGIAFMASVATEVIDICLRGWATKPYAPGHFEQIVMSSSDYAEILAYAPAIWAIFKSDKKSDDVNPADTEQAKASAWAMALFLVGFYLVEDAYTAWYISGPLPIRAIAHMLHYFLLVDFSVYCVSVVYSPQDNKGTMLQRFADALV